MTLTSAPAPASAATSPRLPLWPRFVSHLRYAAPALLLYAGLRALSFGVFLAMAANVHMNWRTGIGMHWDEVHYQWIAQHGYGDHLIFDAHGKLAIWVNRQAFFPLYPLLMRWGAAIPGLSYTSAGMLISTISSLAAAWGLFKVGELLRDRRTGVLLAGLWALMPTGEVQQMVYTESLFTACTVWALYAVLKRRWITAGLICVPAGLTRPTALAAVAAIGLAALIALIKRQDGWRPLAGILIAPLGLAGYMGWLAVRYHRLDAYTYIQNEGWLEKFDGGKQTWHTLISTTSTMDTQQFLHYVTVVVLLALPGLVFFMFRERLPLVLNAYVVVSLPLVLLVHHWPGIIPRYLMPVFPLIIPLAVALGRARLSTRVTVLLTFGVASGWYATWFFWNFMTAI
jgi:Gpi18-like mannosyltransferase